MLSDPGSRDRSLREFTSRRIRREHALFVDMEFMFGSEGKNKCKKKQQQVRVHLQIHTTHPAISATHSLSFPEGFPGP
jgi:hypothetical protein